ncbi:MAG: hypothetical protein Q8J96_13210 [Rhodocyclaceae bacterium]|nr:hypothetical protein [Rhodocyclaceae bacterium]
MMKVGAGGTAPAITSTVVALATLSTGLFIAAHHPLSSIAMIAGCLAAFIICLRFDHAWLLLLPALLPIVDLAPWTGWLTFEEFDILVLGAAAGAWLRHGWTPGVSAPARPSKLLLLLVALYLLFLAVSFARGIADAGGFVFGWFQGYEGSMNSLRLAKSFLLAALFAPLIGRTHSRLDDRGVAYLGWGMVLGLATVSLAALWERIAFPGLLNFSADYRTTALFWEMHVGGAALDGFLVLTLPFAVLLMLRSQYVGQLLPAGLILGLGIYASLTTFSRGVYLAMVISLALMAFLLNAKNPSSRTGATRSKGIILGLVAMIAVAGLAFLVFRHGGYRATLALLGCLGLFMLTMEFARSLTCRLWAAAIAIAIPLILAAFAFTWLYGKGSYGSYATIFLAALVALLFSFKSGADNLRAVALSGTLALPFAAALIANHWGGTSALIDMTTALAILAAFAIWGIHSKQTVWPAGWRSQGIAFAGAMSLAAMVAIFSGGAYMGDRFSTSERDFKGRLQHWQAGLDILQTPGDWLFGKGLGRFPASFFFGAPGNEFPGSYKLTQENQNNFLALSGPRYQIGFGEVLRISQRVSPVPAGRYQLEFNARSQDKVTLGFSLCSKHLLYAEACSGRQIAINGNGDWQHLKLEFNGRQLSGGAWYAPQFIVFSLALENSGKRVDIDKLSLSDPHGRQILANGDFSDEMARWFFTSDHHHMPWHMKNMFLHVLFEHGALGLAAFMALVAVAALRTFGGVRSHHPGAPALAAGIAGFLVVGLFDSLLDAPRVAFLFFLMLLLAIQGRKAG